MLTHFRKLHRPCLGFGSCLPKWRKWSRLLVAASLIAPTAVFGQGRPSYSPQVMTSPLPVQQISPRNGFQQPVIQQVQNTPQAARAIHHLIADMPQAQDELEIIQQRSQLIVTRANVLKVAIADPNVLEVVQYAPNQFAVVGLALGSTTLTLWFENQPEPLIYTVKTIRDPNLDYQRKLDYGKLERRLAMLFPNSKVYLIPMSRKILVRGQARDAQEAAHILAAVRGEVINQEGSLFGPQATGMIIGNGFAGSSIGGYSGGYGGAAGFGGLNAFDLAASFIINELQVPGEFQIALKIRIAEVERTAADSAGVNINAFINNASQSISSAMGAGAGAVTGASSGSTLSGTFENGEIGILLNWLCANGTAKILAEPTATVLSGRNVRFLSGGEFAVPTTVGLGGASGVTTSFRGFGTSLLATPSVIDRDQIRLGVIAEYSNITSQNTVGGIPGLQTRRIETVVEMREGQTMALAGLLSNRTTTEVQRIPLLGDIPYVGPLFFSNKQSTVDENELLILVTPEIVRPMDAQEVPPVPGFDITKPTHEEFWKYNMTEGRPDTGYYQSPPYGSGTTGINVDYQHFNPGPAGSMYSPVPTNPGPAPTTTPGSKPVTTPPPVPPQGQFNSSTQGRQQIPTPLAGRQRQADRPRQPSQSQVIPATNADVRQTNYATALGLQREQNNYRQNNYAPPQQQYVPLPQQ
jgi:pilus assembly protein CpaC